MSGATKESKMKSYAYALSALIAFSGAAFAAETAAPAAAAATKAPAAMKAHGTVSSVDAVGNTLSLKGKKADETFAVAADAKIMQGKKEVKLGDIATGSKVSVTYTKD